MSPDPADPVAAIRAFNRFYTRRIGVLDEAHMGSGFTLGEGRAIYELAQADGLTAKQLGEILGLDAGYLSRVLRRLEDSGLLERRADAKDGRSTRLNLTETGREVFARLDRRSAQLVSEMIAPMGQAEQATLVAAMATVRDALNGPNAPPAAIALRGVQPGDMGWVVERHAVLYGREYGWDRVFEAVVADMAAQIIRQLDDPGARAWIAELNGRRVGCVFLVREPDAEGVARLRLLLLEPEARGMRLGQRLVDACLAFARGAGYREVVLWTHTMLTAARNIYASRGFELIETHFHSDFGPEVQSETWRLTL